MTDEHGNGIGIGAGDSHGADNGLSRRNFLRVTTAGGAVVALSAAGGVSLSSAAQAPRQRPTQDVRVYVLVVDGLRPDEIEPRLTPNLYALRSEGTNFPQRGRCRSWRRCRTT
ncbi:twin-arginine translocation signal domain-containing protein [Saccharomonospora sp. CUA-673]|uniref:twin-arginine translocation signal domain-containing protein n=1 Tax=Saccharomonospora sp. CUA-673 TaxID=1904969 RepID=UPI000A670203|nr:twin-arginine translocation signal domain-containing protein [Saccharomonospora sp. CUA-673]